MHSRFVRNPDVCLDRVIKQRLAILGKLVKLNPIGRSLSSAWRTGGWH
jgi:hypothetical protein